jgi:hypothetical protein
VERPRLDWPISSPHPYSPVTSRQFSLTTRVQYTIPTSILHPIWQFKQPRPSTFSSIPCSPPPSPYLVGV